MTLIRFKNTYRLWRHPGYYEKVVLIKRKIKYLYTAVCTYIRMYARTDASTSALLPMVSTSIHGKAGKVGEK